MHISRKPRLPTGRQGFTLTELLVVIAILAILMVGGFTTWNVQIQKGYDIRRKSDLTKIKAVLEGYFNDNECYPDPAVLNNPVICGSAQFDAQGMPKYLCDPQTKIPYVYVPIGAPPCGGYRIFTKLKYTQDPQISALGCTANACGSVVGVNYGLTSGVPLVP